MGLATDSEPKPLVSEKTGLPEETAKVAVDTVIDYLKDKLPAPVAGQIDSVLDGTSNLEDAGGLAKGLGGLLGRK